MPSRPEKISSSKHILNSRMYENTESVNRNYEYIGRLSSSNGPLSANRLMHTNQNSTMRQSTSSCQTETEAAPHLAALIPSEVATPLPEHLSKLRQLVKIASYHKEKMRKNHWNHDKYKQPFCMPSTRKLKSIRI